MKAGLRQAGNQRSSQSGCVVADTEIEETSIHQTLPRRNHFSAPLKPETRSFHLGTISAHPDWCFMSVPLDVQRKFEQRWAARFVRRVPPVAPKQEPEGQDPQLAAPTEGKKKPAGLSRRA